jgi:hypothetical protein
MKTFKIYALRNPLTDNIFYVGVTGQKTLSSRLSQHIYDAKHYRGKNRDKDEILRTLLSLELRPTIELLLGGLETVEDADLAEIKMIAEYSKKYTLTNVKTGGFDYAPSIY